MELGPPTEEETAPTPHGDEEIIGPSADMAILPAEFYCGGLKSCAINDHSRRYVLADLCVATE
eukprot:14592401-Heterocapsa_arctica.AAC.1